MIEQVFIVCKPSARAAVNSALGAIDPAWALTVRCSFPLRKTRFGPKPTPRLYWASWQAKRAVLQVVRAAIKDIPGVKLVRGRVVGIDSADGIENDPTRGDRATTKYTLRAAIKAAAGDLGVPVPDADLV